MRFLTHIIAAEAEEIGALGGSPDPLEQWSGIEAPGFDTDKFALLHSLLTGDTLQTALERYQPIYTLADETLVLHLSGFLVDRLASFDEDALHELAVELAATQDFENEQWPAETVLGLLTELAELAQLAESQGQSLFARITLQPA